MSEVTGDRTAKAQVTLISVRPSLTSSNLNTYWDQADYNQTQLLFEEVKPYGDQVVALFNLSGSTQNLINYLSSQPPDRFTWVDAHIQGLTKKLGKDVETIQSDLDARSFSAVPYARGNARGEVVLLRLKEANYFRPRLAYLVTRGELNLKEGGIYSNFSNAIGAWSEGSALAADIGGDDFVIFDGATLDRLWSISRADLNTAAVSANADVVRPTPKAPAPPSPPPAPQALNPEPESAPAAAPGPKVPVARPPGPVPTYKRPVTYTTTSWALKSQYKQVFQPGPAQLGPQRPFAIIAWMKVPALAVVSYDFLREKGVDATLSDLANFAPVRVRESVRAGLEELVQAQTPEPISATKLGGPPGNRKLDQLLIGESVLIAAPRADLSLDPDKQQRIVVFPLGNVRHKDAPDVDEKPPQ